MRTFLSIITVLFLVVSCQKETYKGGLKKLTKKDRNRMHNDYAYRKSKIDKENDADKVARKEKDQARLKHNLRVANSNNPKKKMMQKAKASPFGHH